MGYRIRRVDVADVPSLRRLFEGSSGDACVRLATSGEAVVAVSMGGEVVGVAGLGPSFDGQPVEAAAFVTPLWRGRGVGGSMLEVVEAIADERRLPLRPKATVLGEVAA
jgi:GNAT superfamily N-acetyltransferase